MSLMIMIKALLTMMTLRRWWKKSATHDPGDFVLVKYRGKFYREKLVKHIELPEKLQNGQFQMWKPESVIGKLQSKEYYSWIKIYNIDELAENKWDSGNVSIKDDSSC